MVNLVTAVLINGSWILSYHIIIRYHLPHILRNRSVVANNNILHLKIIFYFFFILFTFTVFTRLGCAPNQELIFCDPNSLELSDNELFYMVYQYIHCFCFYISLQAKHVTPKLGRRHGIDVLQPLVLNSDLITDLYHFLKKNVRTEIVLRMLPPWEVLESTTSERKRIFLTALTDVERKELVRTVVKYISDKNQNQNSSDFLQDVAFCIIHLFPPYKTDIGVLKGSEIFFDRETNTGYLKGATYYFQRKRSAVPDLLDSPNSTPKGRGRPSKCPKNLSLEKDSEIENDLESLKGLISPTDDATILHILQKTAAYRKARKILFLNPFEDYSFFFSNTKLVSFYKT